MKKNNTSFVFEWANCSETIVNAKTITEACTKIKTDPTKILTGYIIKITKIQYNPHKETDYWWDAEQFWRNLKRRNRRRL